MKKSNEQQQEQVNIGFTKEQFLILLKTIYLGSWVANAHRIGDGVEGFDQLESYIFSFAKELGFDELVEKEVTYKKSYYPSRYFEEETEVRELIDEYDEAIFWEELAEHLTEARFANQYSEEERKEMSGEDRLAKFYEIHDEIAEILEEHGMEAIRLKE